MKRFILCLALALTLFGTAALAIGETATTTEQKFFADGERIPMQAYTINDENFVRLRDVAKYGNFAINYVASTDSIYITTNTPYVEETNVAVPYPPTAVTAFSTQTIYVDGKWQYMMAHLINDNNYVRLRDVAKWADFDVDYDGVTDSVYMYCKTVKPTPTPEPTDSPNARADAAVTPFIDGLKGLTDREKIVKLADYLCDRIEYDFDYADAVKNSLPYDPSKGSYDNIFAGSGAKGICSTYASAFRYLCKKAGVPCVTVGDYDHAWNEVYVDGEWLIVDATNYDTARDQDWLLTTYSWYPKSDNRPEQTAKDKADALK